MNDFLPTFFFVERATSDDASRAAARKENASRPAAVEITHITKHTGQERIAQPLYFPVTFRTEPHFTSGSAVVHHPDAKNWHDPVANSGVYQWVRDDDGNYIAAKVWLRVDMYRKDGTTGIPPAVTTQHYLTFTGIAIKDLPTSQIDPALTPRAVGL